MKWTNFLVWITACVVLTACSGGGNSGPPPFSVSLNQSSLSFEYAQGTVPQPQVLTATWTGEPPGNVYIAAVIEGQGITPQIPITISSANAQAVVSAQSNLPVGTYIGRVLIMVCSDPACTNRIGGSPLAVGYTVRARTPTLASIVPISLQYVTGAAIPGTTPNVVTTTASAGTWSAVASASWIQLSATQGTGAASIGVGFNPAGLAEGTYSGRVTVTGGDGFAQSVSVQLTVRAPTLDLNSSTMNFVSTLGVTPANQTITLSISNNVASSWTATSSVPWLTLDKTAGATPDSLQLGISSTLAPRSGNYQAEVTINAVQNGLTFRRTIAINLTLTKPTLIVSGAAAFIGINGSAIADQTTSVALSNGVAAPIILTPDQPWITPRAFSVIAGTQFNIGINQSAGTLGEGLFNGSIVASTILNSETISVSIPVSIRLSNPGLVFANRFMFFSGINGAPIASQSQVVSVDNGAPITLDLRSNQPWLRVTDSSTGATKSFTVSIDASALASASYEGQLTIGARLNGSLITRVVFVNMSLTKPTITLSDSSVTVGGSKGRDSTPVPLTLSLNTGSNTFAWNVSGVPSWLELSRTSGATSVAGQTITLSPRRQQATVGTSTATLSFTTVVNGDTLTTTLPVSYNLDTHRLVAAEVGVAFVKAGNWSRLTRSVNVRSNYDAAGTWTAVSNQPWLSVTASGAHGSNLELTADPSILPTDQWYDTTVTITSSDTTVTNPERIRVGLWVGTAAPATPQTLVGDYSFFVTDPIRPYLYTHGNAGTDTDIKVVHMYTGAQVGVIPMPSTSPGPMTISSDGSYLFVLDQRLPTLRVVDLTSRSVISSYPTQYSGVAYTGISYVRTGGVGLISTPGRLHQALSGAEVSRTGISTEPTGSVTLDGRYSFTSAHRFIVDYSDAEGGVVSFQDGGQLPNLSKYFGAAPNVDGSRVTVAGSTAAGDVAQCFIVNGLTLTQVGTIGPNQPTGQANNAATSVNNASLCTIYFQFQPQSADNFWLYNASGTLITSLHLGPLASRIIDGGAKFSGDGFVTAITPVQISQETLSLLV